MKLGLINSAWAQANVSVERGIQLTKDIGFDTIDIFSDPLDLTASDWRNIREGTRRSGLPVISVVCIAFGMLDFNPSVHRFAVERAKRHADFAHDLEARNILLVLGENYWQLEVFPAEALWSFAVDGVRQLGEYSDKLGLEVALELEPFHNSILNSVDKLVKFVDDVGLPNVKVNCDISHLDLVNAPPSEVAKLKGKIGHVHLSDCDGKVHGDLPPGRGVTPIKDYLKAIQDTGFDGTVSIELEYSPEPDKIVEWVTEAYRETDRIMQALNARR